MSEQRKNRVYVADCEDWGIVCIAPTLKEAKKLLWADDNVQDYTEGGYTDMRVSWRKDLDAGDLPVGIPDDIVALKAGLYSSLQEGECPECGYVGKIIYDSDIDLVGCEGCVEMAQNEVEEEIPQLASDDYVDTEVE